MRTHRGLEPPDEVWMQGLGTPLWVQFRHWTEDPAEIDAMVATYRAYNLEHHDAMVRPYDGVVAAVRDLKRRDKTLGLVTSKVRSGALRGLQVAGLEDAFQVIVGSDEVTHPKPHPEPVLKALEQLGVPAPDAVFIGDSRHDIECGRAAGVKTAAAPPGPRYGPRPAHPRLARRGAPRHRRRRARALARPTRSRRWPAPRGGPPGRPRQPDDSRRRRPPPQRKRPGPAILLKTHDAK